MLPALQKLINAGNAVRPEQLAQALGVPLPTLHSWVRRGKIPFFKIERVTVFDPAQIADWFEAKEGAQWHRPAK